LDKRRVWLQLRVCKCLLKLDDESQFIGIRQWISTCRPLGFIFCCHP